MEGYLRAGDDSSGYQYAVQEDFESFKGPRAVFIDADGNEVVYQYEELNTSMDMVANEEIVTEETCDDLTWQPSTSQGHVVNQTKYARIAQPTVLLSAKSLEMGPITPSKRRRIDSSGTVTNNNSALNKNLPLMKNVFQQVQKRTLDEIDKSLGNKGTKSRKVETPIFSTKSLDFSSISEILHGIVELSQNQICTSVPQRTRKECSYVIEVCPETNLEEDGMGSWGKFHVKYFSYRDNGDGSIIRVPEAKDNDFDYRICLKRYCHPNTKLANEKYKKFGFFVKKVFTFERKPNSVCLDSRNLAILTYEWQRGEEFEFLAENWEELLSMESYTYQQPLYSLEPLDAESAIEICLGGVTVPHEKIARGVPQRFTGTGTFVVDLSKLKHPDEIRIDSNGSWSKPHGKAWYYNVCPSTGKAIRIKCPKNPESSLQYQLKVTLRRHENKDADDRFVRKIFTARNPQGGYEFEGNPYLAVLIYSWRGERVHFEPSMRQNWVHKTLNTRLGQRESESNEDEDFSEATSVREQQELPASPEHPENRKPTKVKKAQLMVLQKQWENQTRLSQVLDRAETFLTRVEEELVHNSEFVEVYPAEEQIWDGEHIIEQQEIIEEVIHHN